MLHAIEQAPGAGYRMVVFTGGEPTLAGEHLLAGIRHAAERGLRVRLVTNAHWASGTESAEQFVSRLVEAGLDEINISTGDQHARFVPLANIWRALRAALPAGLATVLIAETAAGRAITRESLERDPEWLRLRDDFPYAELRVMEWTWSPLGPFQREQYAESALLNRRSLPQRGGCDNIFSNTTLQPNGSLCSCCGLGMRLIPELQAGRFPETTLADADRAMRTDPLKRWIHEWGPERILAWAASIDPEIRWEDLYAHQCQACIRIFRDPRVRRLVVEHLERNGLAMPELLTSAPRAAAL